MRVVQTLALVLTLAGLALPAAPVGAQPPPPGVDAALDAARAEAGRALEVSVLTFANGAVLWERFGHNALVVTDTTSGQSLAYNWGVFDFDQPNFLARFLTGDTRYWLAVYPTDAMFAAYVADDRTARRQVLALDDVQKAALAEYVNWNAQGEARFYRYDYYLDNCSTRVRDAIERVLGGRLEAALSNVPTQPTTWRDETARVTDGDWPPYAGIQVALGRNADHPLTRWDESFMPGRLADHLADCAHHRRRRHRARARVARFAALRGGASTAPRAAADARLRGAGARRAGWAARSSPSAGRRIAGAGAAVLALRMFATRVVPAGWCARHRAAARRHGHQARALHGEQRFALPGASAAARAGVLRTLRARHRPSGRPARHASRSWSRRLPLLGLVLQMTLLAAGVGGGGGGHGAGARGACWCAFAPHAADHTGTHRGRRARRGRLAAAWAWRRA